MILKDKFLTTLIKNNLLDYSSKNMILLVGVFGNVITISMKEKVSLDISLLT
jgi:hypothetical protein